MSAPAAGPYESWELPEALWAILEPLLPVRNATRGRPRIVDLRRIAAGVFFILRTGIQWHALPREPYGPSSTVYYYFRQWQDDGVFRKLWVKALEFYDFVEGIDWEWISIDGAMRKAPLGGEKKWAQSDRPGEIGDEAQPGLGGRGDADRDRDRGRELSRPEAAGRDVGGDCGAATAKSGGQAA
jgi:putative transposase